MDTISIEHMLRKIAKKYRRDKNRELNVGVFASDELPMKKMNETVPLAYVINTDPSNKPGTHWQAIWRPEQSKNRLFSCYFFDSFGRPPTGDQIRGFIKMNSDETVWCNQQLQSSVSISCGEWCCVYLSCVCSGFCPLKFCKQFSSDFEDNDTKIMRMYRTSFSSSKVRQYCCRIQK